jgi:hypothetical protein
MNNSILEEVRKAIDEVFGEYISQDPVRRREIIERSTFVGKDDPGGWAPNAAVTIHCESGIPSGLYSSELFEKWFSVSDRLRTHFCEHINSAVIGVYRN